jgi:hypothetical protein
MRIAISAEDMPDCSRIDNGCWMRLKEIYNLKRDGVKENEMTKERQIERCRSRTKREWKTRKRDMDQVTISRHTKEVLLLCSILCPSIRIQRPGKVDLFLLPNKVASNGLDHDLLRAAAPEMRFPQCKDFPSKENTLLLQNMSCLKPLNGEVRGYLKLLWSSGLATREVV